ncbi:hypothetical protein [Oerskovia turbata]
MDAQTALTAHDDLLWIVSHWPDLKARLHGGGGNALTGLPGGSAENPLPIDVHVSDLMREIEDQARFYAAVLLDEVPPEHGCGGQCARDWFAAAAQTPGLPAPDVWDCPERRDPITTSTMPALLGQVAKRYGHFTTDEREALDFCDEAHDFRERVRKTLERPAPPTYVGPCRSRTADGAGCAGELYLREGRDSGICRECGTEFTEDEQRAYIEGEIDHRLMTATEIGSALVVLGFPAPASTIRSWIGRERLKPVGPGEPRLYRLVEALDLAKARVGRAAA